MLSLNKSNSYIIKLILCLPIIYLFLLSNSYASGGILNFKTKIVIGTCDFDDSNDFDKEINFEKPFSVNDVEKSTINSTIDSKSFSYYIKCNNFASGSEKKIHVNVKPASNTHYSNKVFFSSDDKTNTGYTLTACNTDKSICQDVENNNPFIFSTHSDDLIGINYTVNFVKRQNNVQAGNSNAAITLEYIQD